MVAIYGSPKTQRSVKSKQLDTIAPNKSGLKNPGSQQIWEVKISRMYTHCHFRTYGRHHHSLGCEWKQIHSFNPFECLLGRFREI